MRSTKPSPYPAAGPAGSVRRTNVLALVVLAAALLGSARLPAQFCPEITPPDMPGWTADQAVCTPFSLWRLGPPITLNTRWKGGPPIGVPVPIDTGICFQVDADDRDLHVVDCVNDGHRYVDKPLTAELINYTYWVNATNLPMGGEFRGLGLTSAGLWQFPSAKYHIHRDTPPGNYLFTMACMIDDEAAEKDDGPVFWTVDVRIAVTADCELVLVGFENEQVVTTPQADGPFTGSNCCDPDAGFWVGPSIKPVLPCEGIVPRFVESEQYDIFGSLFLDFDYLFRACDDTQTCPMPQNAAKVRYDPNVDSLYYQWTVENLIVPGQNGQFVLANAPETVLWKAPQLGMLRVCLRVTDRGNQATDPATQRLLDQIVMVGPPGVVRGQGVMDGAPIEGASKLKCTGLRMWRNADDDDEDGSYDLTAPPRVDNDLGWVELGMADKYRFTIQDPTNPHSIDRVRLYRKNASSDFVPVPSGSTVNIGDLAGYRIWIEGIFPSTAVNDIKLQIVRQFNAGGACDLVVPDKEYEIPITVFGVRSVEFIAGGANAGEAKAWTGVPAHEVPSGIRGLPRLDERFYVEPGARLGQDAPDLGSHPDHPVWNQSTRDHVQVRATIQPAVAGIQVHLGGFDVDDHLVDSSGHSNPNFVDDESDLSIAGEQDNRGLMVDAAGNVQIHEAGRMATALGGAQSAWVSAFTDANGRFDAFFVASLTPGDNFRVLATLVPEHVGVTHIMAPNSQRLGSGHSLKDHGLLFYRAPIGKTPVLIEETRSTGIYGPTVQSHELTVRRVIHVSERRFGTHHVTLAPPQLAQTLTNRDLERTTSGVLRYVSRFNANGLECVARAVLPPASVAYLSNSPNVTMRTEGDVDAAYAYREFSNGRVEMLVKTVANSDFARVTDSFLSHAHLGYDETNSGFHYSWGTTGTHPLLEVKSYHNTFVPWGKWVLIRSNTPPPTPWPAAPIVIGGEQFTVHHVYGSGPYDYYCKAAHGLANMDHIALIPMVFKSDDFRFGFETANHTLTPSPLDIAVPGFQPTDLLVDKLFADQCLRVQRIGNVAVQPFAFIPQRSEHTKRFANFVGGYPVGAKSWAVYLDHYAHTYLDQDNDPDGPGTTTFAWASGQLMGGGYLQVLFSNEPLWDYFAEQNNGPGSPYSLHGYGAGLTRVEMARARLLVHELCHHLLPSCPDRAPYLGLKGDEHNLPGIMSSMWRQDPLLGNQWVEHFYEVVNGAHLESGPGPYVTWYLRTQLDWLQKHQ